MKLSDGEKLIILMLADLHKALKIKDAEIDPAFISKAILYDKLWGINWEYHGIPFEKSEDPPALKETADFLDMWMFIEESYAKLSTADKKLLEKEAEPFGTHVIFPGFDGNNEEHYGIARFLIKDMKKFEHFAKHELNSHSISVDAYRRMYRVFEPMRIHLGSRRLNAGELIAILKERTHPMHRKGT